MSKKLTIIFVLVGLAFGIAGGAYFFSRNIFKNNPKETSFLESEPSGGAKESVLEGDLTYNDESGFSFSYPSGITVKDTTPDDSAYYSELTLSKSGKLLKVSALDTKEKSVDLYVKNDSLLSKASLSGAVKMGEMSGKQYTTGDELFTLALDQGVLYMIEGPKDGDYWEKVQGIVIDSFSFANQKNNTGAGGSDNTIYEEEEVVE